MKNLTLILILISTLAGCSKEGVKQVNDLEEKLLGRWEVVETLSILDNGDEVRYTFGPNGDFPAAYSIGIDYSSGFDLQKNGTLDLIWYGNNKGQFFDWKLNDYDLIIDNGRLVFSVIHLDDSTVEFESNERKRWYKMVKLD